MKRIKKPIYFCPKCKSTNVMKETNITIILGIPQQWKCNNCNFKSHLFPQAIPKSKKNKKTEKSLK